MSLFRFLRDLFLELSDQRAYHAHLAAKNVPASGPEWRTFIDARHRRKYQSPKCC